MSGYRPERPAPERPDWKELKLHRPPQGPPMDLANMRSNGVRALSVDCLDCTHSGVVNVDDQPGHVAVPSFAKRMRCTICGSKRVHFSRSSARRLSRSRTRSHLFSTITQAFRAF